MFTIKRIDAKKPANYENTIYPTMSDVDEQLKRLGVKEEDCKWAVDEWIDPAPGELILTGTNNKGHKFEVRYMAIAGYPSYENRWYIEEIIACLKGACNEKYLSLIRAIARKVVED